MYRNYVSRSWLITLFRQYRYVFMATVCCPLFPPKLCWESVDIYHCTSVEGVQHNGMMHIYCEFCSLQKIHSCLAQKTKPTSQKIVPGIFSLNKKSPLLPSLIPFSRSYRNCSGSVRWLISRGEKKMCQLWTLSIDTEIDSELSVVQNSKSLVVQWLRLCAPRQGSPVWSLFRELDPSCCN